ncbi:cobaltochelatase subunit CobN [Sphingobium chlorophenolicum]|uniref:Cobaltochelatase subunit CobN n=1 Tax=Sphingobium chlorophenolicum TaxID=46429 RepID=A0A081R9M4_SPHCR|nr:cobaltochelatase subunit CobN [Sphingobium chlorophenolicum]KEQ51897.1 Cobaltochelatase, CobN subunit [Sphingobium chlorophenolicum]
MHLLTATPGTVSNGDEAIDLGQSPGDIVLLTVADSELACFASAAAVLGEAGPKIRLANLLQLKHPYSVDLYVEKVIAHAKFVCVILLGGKSYWSYGIDEIANISRKKGIAFAAIADGREDDPDLRAASTLPVESCDRLRDYLRQGGIPNAVAFLKTAARLAGFDAGVPDAPVPVADAGLYLPVIDRPTLEQVKFRWKADQPTALFLFYRALLIAGTLEAVDAMIAGLEAAGLNVLPVHVRALREPFARDFLHSLMGEAPPDVILNATAFAASAPGEPRTPSILEQADCPILQTIFASAEQGAWEESARGLGPRDLAMHIALPEVDGRLFTRAVAFKASTRFDQRTECDIIVPRILADRVNFVSQLTKNWAKLRKKPVADRRIALILANYPNKNGRIGNGVGLDTPASAAAILSALKESGYTTADAPTDGAALMRHLTAGTTNALIDPPLSPFELSLSKTSPSLSLADYHAAFSTLPDSARQAIATRWGHPEVDPFFRDGAFRLPVHRFGNVAVAVQPSRGYHIDPKSSYHDPALPPPHAYLAFHVWLAREFGAHAVVHVGKHGNLEWLPGKAIALSESCFPEICAGPIPQIYPFIVNDPGEGTQAKRRIGACIIDHLTPPLTRADTYGPLKELEALVDEYYLAAGMDPRRLETLRKDILALAASQGLDKDAGAQGSGDDALAAIDNYLCDLKEMQIRNGLHVFTRSPEGALRRDLLIALARCPRGMDDEGQQSLLRALADDLELGFDPLDCIMGTPWAGPRPEALQHATSAPWRTTGDTVERLELYAIELMDGQSRESENPSAISSPKRNVQEMDPRLCGDDDWALKRTTAVLTVIEQDLAPRVDACGEAEKSALLKALNGNFVPPGPSGAPTRGRPDVLPTGRNFYSVDTRAVPTVAAWNLGQRSADLIVQDYLQREGDYPRAIALSAWGTANMRTGGDDIAQALALMGVRPRWDWASGRVIGFEVMKIAELNRPRVDVTFRVSGFFRDAFPEQIDLLDSAARAVMALDEPEEENPAAARHRAETAALIAEGIPEKAARRRAGARVFGSKPGAYGAGLQAMIDEKIWHDRADLANVYLDWGSYAYGGGVEGDAERSLFAERLIQTDALIQNQDNREHDLLDSDDYYQFEGGIAAAVEHLSGKKPLSYHNDHSRPERPVIRMLEDEIGRIVRARVTNPKWIAGVMRHGYKGAFEIAASVDYLFAFAATTHAVKDHHFDAVHAAFIEDEAVRAFMAEANPAALRETAARLHEALDRRLWKPRSNSAAMLLAQLKDAQK